MEGRRRARRGRQGLEMAVPLPTITHTRPAHLPPMPTRGSQAWLAWRAVDTFREVPGKGPCGRTVSCAQRQRRQAIASTASARPLEQATTDKNMCSGLRSGSKLNRELGIIGVAAVPRAASHRERLTVPRCLVAVGLGASGNEKNGMVNTGASEERERQQKGGASVSSGARWQQGAQWQQRGGGRGGDGSRGGAVAAEEAVAAEGARAAARERAAAGSASGSRGARRPSASDPARRAGDSAVIPYQGCHQESTIGVASRWVGYLSGTAGATKSAMENKYNVSIACNTEWTLRPIASVVVGHEGVDAASGRSNT